MAALLLGLACVLPSHAHKAHVHGEGKLDAVIDGAQIVLQLAMPLEAVVGFERAPKNESESKALRDAQALLSNAPGLFIPTPAAGCVVEAAQVQAPQFDGSGHADIEARYAFRCQNPQSLQGIETTLFRHFKRLHRIETQRIGPRGQGAQRLTPRQPVLNW
jgi:hypothetical protein